MARLFDSHAHYIDDRFAELDAGAVNAYANEYMSQYYWADFMFNDF